MGKRGYAYGFALTDIIKPVAIILLLAAGVGHYYSRGADRSRQSQVHEVAEEMFGDEAEAVLKDIHQMAAREIVGVRPKRTAEVASADPVERPTPRRDKDAASRVNKTARPGEGAVADGKKPLIPAASASDRPTPAAAKKPMTATAKSTQKKPSAQANRQGRGTQVSSRRKFSLAGRPLAIAERYDQRCQNMMDEMTPRSRR